MRIKDLLLAAIIAVALAYALVYWWTCDIC